MSAAAGARGPEAGARRSARKTGPEVRPRRSRGGRRAVPVAQWTYSIAPPLEWTRPRRNSRSRSSMLRDRSSSARAAVSYSIRHRTRSRRPCRSSVNSLSRRVRGMERSPRRAGLRRSSRRPIFIDAVGWLRERLYGRELLQVADPPDLPLMIEPRLAPLGVPLHTRRISDLQLLGHEVQHRQWNIQRILQNGPDPADRHQLEREPELHVLAAMTVDQRPVLVIEVV